MAVRYQDSVHKIAAQLSVVARADFELDGKRYAAPAALKLSPTFWRKYGCYLNCGACCLSFTLDYLPDERVQLPDHIEVQSRIVRVNGKARQIYTHMQQGRVRAHGKEWCDYLDKNSGACTIHEHNPFSCQIELIKFKQINGVGYIQKAPFGRAWNMIKSTDGEHGVLCDFEQFDIKQFEENDVPALQRMQQWAVHLGVNTHLPKVLEAVRACVAAKQLRTFVIYN